MKVFTLGVALLMMATLAQAADFEYMTVLLRAAPGSLPQLIETLKDDIDKHEQYGIEQPYLMRHSQGDQWDLLLIIPIGNRHEWYAPEAIEKRKNSNSFDKPYYDEFYELIAHHEELIATGPSYELFRNRFESYDFYHVEMFVAVPGRRKELLRQREMENVYYAETGRQGNLIFTRVAGSAWDVFTIGFYSDLGSFATSSDVIPKADKENAARKAGFKNLDHISFYLRELITMHHDTLAGAVR